MDALVANEPTPFTHKQGERWTCERCGLTLLPRTTYAAASPPMHNCPAKLAPAVVAQYMVARMLADIDAAIAAGTIPPWESLGRDRAAVVDQLARCAACPRLTPAGCDRFAATPCKAWSLWRQSLLVGQCDIITPEDPTP